jgi:hypothetical protein
MYIEDTQCCAMREIAELSQHRTAEDAMMGFCKAHIGYYPSLFSAFYIFTGVVKQPGPYQSKYGPEFASYIKRNKLGIVTESVTRSNRVNHPDHLVKVWTWATSQRGLEAWCKKHHIKLRGDYD